VTEPDFQSKTQGVADSNELVSGQNRDKNKASFLLDHLIFTDPVDATSPQNIGAFDKLV
jgi:hypothetical protein